MPCRPRTRGRGALLGLFWLLCSLDSQARPPAQAAIASAHPLANAAGRSALEAGGNAFDAAVAVSAALAVVEPYSSGLGGGGFFLLRKNGQGSDDPASYHFIDARERAPLQASPDLYRREGKVQPALSLDGALAAAIPGLPAALVHLAERHGRLPLRRSLAPAIELAHQGFAVDRVYRQRATFRLAALRDDPQSAQLFLVQNQVPDEGHVLRQPDLAATLQRLAEQGSAGFYGGETARRLVKGVQAAGGIWSLDDLAAYRVVERAPLRFTLQAGRELISAPPPSAGGVAIAQSLAMLQQLPWRQAEPLQRSHYVVETLRRAYRDRARLGDPDFVDNPLDALLGHDYLKALAGSIDPARASTSAELPQPWHEDDHTTHFALIDADGNAVAATLSINLPFGAAFTAPGTGVLLNDEMDDFAADLSGANAYGLAGSARNAIAAGKRPLSSMSPTFIESQDEFAAFGTPGGSRIPSMVLLSILQYLDDQPIERWVAAPRYHHQFLPDLIEYEPGAFDAEQAKSLQVRGHHLKALDRSYGNQQVLLWDKRSAQVQGASDPRGVGQALLLPPRPVEGIKKPVE